MDASVFFLDQHKQLDSIFDNLDAHGFAIIDQVYPATFMQALAKECLSHLNEFKQAAIQHGVMSQIRSDHILWIDPNLPRASRHTEMLRLFSEKLNQTFFFGIREVEAHFACYNMGEFYALHRDNPQQKNDRIISTVFYLHSEWNSKDGGELRLQDKNGLWHLIEPQPNRLVIFLSDLLHEVLLSKRQRLSITAWLRSSHSLWDASSPLIF